MPCQQVDGSCDNTCEPFTQLAQSFYKLAFALFSQRLMLVLQIFSQAGVHDQRQDGHTVHQWIACGQAQAKETRRCALFFNNRLTDGYLDIHVCPFHMLIDCKTQILHQNA